MPNALDMFRAQRDAAEAVQRTLHETTAVLIALRQEVDRLVGDERLRCLVRDERALLDRADAFLHQVRWFREREIARFWPGVAALVAGRGVRPRFGHCRRRWVHVDHTARRRRSCPVRRANAVT